MNQKRTELYELVGQLESAVEDWALSQARLLQARERLFKLVDAVIPEFPSHNTPNRVALIKAIREESGASLAAAVAAVKKWEELA